MAPQAYICTSYTFTSYSFKSYICTSCTCPSYIWTSYICTSCICTCYICIPFLSSSYIFTSYVCISCICTSYIFTSYIYISYLTSDYICTSAHLHIFTSYICTSDKTYASSGRDCKSIATAKKRRAKQNNLTCQKSNSTQATHWENLMCMGLLPVWFQLTWCLFDSEGGRHGPNMASTWPQLGSGPNMATTPSLPCWLVAGCQA